jgi:hypothetical protein
LSLEAAELIGDTQSWRELQLKMESFGGNCYLRGGFAVKYLGMRLSGGRVLDAAIKLFREPKRLPVPHQTSTSFPTNCQPSG